MRNFSKLIIFFYTVIFSLIGVCLIAFALHFVGRIDLSMVYAYILDVPNFALILGGSGVCLILINFYIISVSFRSFQKEKTIGYVSSSGQVIISLSAIEDFIRKLTQHLPEVKELRSSVFVTRKGIEIESKIILWATSNIPSITEKVQNIIRGQVQELLTGIEKPIMVNVHVVKIAQKTVKEKQESSEIPFLR